MSPKNAPSGASLALAVVALLCAPLAARAADETRLEADVVVEQDWDSNIYATKDHETGSLVTIVRPSLHFANIGELGFFRVNGWLSSHSYWEESKLNGVDRGASLDFDQKLTPRFSLFGSGSLLYFADHNEIRENGTVTSDEDGQPIVTPGEIIEGNVPDVTIDQGIGGVRYALTPLTDLSLSGGPYSVSYGESAAGGTENRDRGGWSAELSLDHQLTPIDEISFDLNATSTDNEDVVFATEAFEVRPPLGSQPGSQLVDLETGKSISEQQSLTVGWKRQWSPVWSTNLAVGARRLHTEVNGASGVGTQVIIVPPLCIPFLGCTVGGPTPSATATKSDFDDTGPGVVGELHLTRSFLRSSLDLGYSRVTRSTSSAVTSDVDVDTFSLVYTHLLAERVTLRLSGNYELYESANDSPSLVPAEYIVGSVDIDSRRPRYWCPNGGKRVVTGSGVAKVGQCETSEDNALHSQTLGLTARIDWQLRKRLGTFAVFRYFDRSGDEELFGNDYNKVNFGVGFRYFYDLDL